MTRTRKTATKELLKEESQNLNFYPAPGVRYPRKSLRILQFATKVSLDFDSQVREIANKEGIYIAEVLERCLAAYLYCKDKGINGQELKNILDIIGEKKIRQTYQLETEDRRLIQTYLKERRKEEKEVKKVAKKEKQDKKDLVKYGIKKEPLTWEDIAKGTKENYEPKKRNQTSKK
ncbi:11360_t:CDS:2 [Cetraspora pellucida]|uniref:11360_t:CDS:1 n=1 Tax=Cetraspora pellucida TaxID=1433469 RepID=A0ACA9KCB6_9GLOM|nr:11360_t:CDS:2 [Cetraspora pellucida]